MDLYIGIDGGGSTLRVAVTDSQMQVLRLIHDPRSANPTSIGDEPARQRLQQALIDALQGYDLSQIRACGAGISGTAQRLDWVRQVLGEVLPNITIVAVSDVEIALVGAHGKREGILVLAGTGSVVYGISSRDSRADPPTRPSQTCMVGGWGYVLGDEGSGFWLGQQALKHIGRCADEGELTSSAQHLLSSVGVAHPRQISAWLYQDFSSQKVAGLAPQVLALAQAGDSWALALIHEGAQHLARQAQQVIERLALIQPIVALAGGLLENPTPLRTALEKYLTQAGYAVLESPVYTPVIGAALLAKLTLS
jgi:N-acetylglucosamine kinase-like BadF-type ATPase